MIIKELNYLVIKISKLLLRREGRWFGGLTRAFGALDEVDEV